MKDTIRLGAIDGITVTASWTLLPVVALITWSVAAGILPEVAPGADPLAYWITALAVTPLFFGSLLAHELGHSIVARKHGVQVKEITLWLFGGVSKLESDCPSGEVELKIAVVGPGVSIVLSFAWAVASGVASLLGAPELVVAGLAWLAAVNLVLGIFNLLPAFPLDGGRVLRAFLWMRSGERVSATNKAAAVGRVLSTVLLVLGLMEFLSTGSVGGLWLAFIGWFVLQAGRAESAAVTQHDLLGDLPVWRLMSRPVLTAPADIDVASFVEQYVLGSRHSAYPVLDRAGRVLGLVTLDGIREVAPAQRAVTPIGAVATPLVDLVVTAPDEPVAALMARIAANPTGRALVFESGRLVGIVSLADISRALEIGAITHTTAT